MKMGKDKEINNENKKLSQMWEFKAICIICGIPFAGFLIAILIGNWQCLEWTTDVDKINRLFHSLKVPGILLTIWGALLTAISTIHRSSQSAKQIEKAERQIQETIKQNNFSNYYKHKEEFQKFMNKKLEESLTTPLKDRILYCETAVFHDFLFPNLREKGLNKKDGLINDVITCINDIEEMCAYDILNIKNKDIIRKKGAFYIKGSSLLLGRSLPIKIAPRKEITLDMLRNRISKIGLTLNAEYYTNKRKTNLEKELDSIIRSGKRNNSFYFSAYTKLLYKINEEIRTVYELAFKSDIIYSQEAKTLARRLY